MNNRKELLEDLRADLTMTVTITPASGRSFTARVRKFGQRDLELFPPIELLELELGRIELVEESPAEADMRPGGGRAAV